MKKAFQEFLKRESQPMRQATYWIIYVASAYIIAIKTVEASVMASYDLIEMNPDLAQYTSLVKYLVF